MVRYLTSTTRKQYMEREMHKWNEANCAELIPQRYTQIGISSRGLQCP